jgi:EF-P beta-lysylation protein EpmB
LHIPQFYQQLIDFKDKNDPLLLQVMPHASESIYDQEFTDDPVGDLKSRKVKGVIHKYHGRVLLIASGTCAINCRYCFRRNFPYTQNNASAQNWQQAFEYLSQNTDVHEVILSGGDPLMLSTKVLNKFTQQLNSIKHIKTLRIHTRLPLVSPSRININFIQWLNSIELNKVMVLHCNHPNELHPELKNTFTLIKNTNTLLLNQSVLLKNINDDAKTLITLSHKLFEFGILPYYLNQLDKVKGARHFYVTRKHAKSIHQQLLKQLSGYLVPKLVEEISGKNNKTPLI